MNNELIILKSFIISSAKYHKYNTYLNRDYFLSALPELYKILSIIDLIYKDNIPVSSVEHFIAVFYSKYPGLKKAEMAALDTVFNRLKAVDLSTPVLDMVLEDHRKRVEAAKLAEVAWDTSEGKKSVVELLNASESFKESMASTIIQPDMDPFVSDDLALLLGRSYGQPGVKWRLKTLRVMMGSLRKGDFGFIFARPEVGKSTFLADMGCHFASQMDRPYLHLNNEESGTKIKLRYIQAALGKTTREISQNIEESQRKYLEVTNNNIKIYDSASLSKQMVEELCIKLNPGMIVIDSIDKIKGFEDDRDDLVYKQIYSWARELAKQYGPVIGVCHASANGDGKRYLEMDDVAYAKTAKQGEADWILGIGRSYDNSDEHYRFFHLPKNKLMGDEEMKEEYRHGKVKVRILPDVAQYDDVMFSNDED